MISCVNKPNHRVFCLRKTIVIIKSRQVLELLVSILAHSIISMMKQVVWTDHSSYLLSFMDRRIINDERMSVERPLISDWNLHIHDVSLRDQGKYTCQVNTMPVMIMTAYLVVEGEITLFISI